MKKTLILIGLIALSACVADKKSGSRFIITKCLDGIEYYASGYKLAVRIDPKTMTYSKCEG